MGGDTLRGSGTQGSLKATGEGVTFLKMGEKREKKERKKTQPLSDKIAKRNGQIHNYSWIFQYSSFNNSLNSR